MEQVLVVVRELIQIDSKNTPLIMHTDQQRTALGVHIDYDRFKDAVFDFLINPFCDDIPNKNLLRVRSSPSQTSK